MWRSRRRSCRVCFAGNRCRTDDLCGGMAIESDLTSECVGYIATGIAQLIAKNDAMAAAGETEVNIVGIVQGGGDVPSYDVQDMVCNAVDIANAAAEINVTPVGPSVKLGDTVQFSATPSNVTWSLEDGSLGDALGAINANTGLYTAPSVAPAGNYCAFYSAYYEDSCPITIIAKSNTNNAVQTLATLLLSSGNEGAAPTVQNLAPNPIAAGSTAQTLFINGYGFLAGDMVTFNGSSRQPDFNNPNQLQLPLSAANLANPASFPLTVSHTFVAITNGSSTPVNLQVTAAPTPTPTAPQPVSPGSTTSPGNSIATTVPTLSWTSTGAAQYYLAISKAPYGSSNIVYSSGQINGGLTSYTVPPGFLFNGINYRWNMQAYTSAGWSPVSSSHYFTVNAGALPDMPTNLSTGASSPGSEITVTNPTLEWTGSGATTYELAISNAPYGKNNTFYDVPLIPSSTTSWAVPSGVLQDGVSYAWNVQATNSAGQSPWSTPFYFTVNSGSGGPPQIPSGLSPGGGSSPGPTIATVTPTLTWNVSTGATAYSVAVENTSGKIVYGANVTTNTAPIPSGTLANGTAYLWTVSASNSAGSSSPASIEYFTINTGTAPVLSVTPTNPSVTPAAGSTNISVSNAGAGALSYSSTVTSGSAWLSIASGATGGNSGTIAVSCSANTGGQRSGTIQVTASGASGSPATVTVTQSGVTTSNIRISESQGFDILLAPSQSEMDA